MLGPDKLHAELVVVKEIALVATWPLVFAGTQLI